MKRKLLIISHVKPINPASGQELRVFNTIKSASKFFDVTLIVLDSPKNKHQYDKQLGNYLSDVHILPYIHNKNILLRLFFKLIEFLYPILTPLKASNFLIGKVNLTPKRVLPLFNPDDFDFILIEYFYVWRIADALQAYKSKLVLDTHNIMWQTLQKQLLLKGSLTKSKTERIRRYKEYEEKTWGYFSTILSINQTEHEYIQTHTTKGIVVKLMMMGVDITDWFYDYQLDMSNLSIVYYGSLGTIHNRKSAMEVANYFFPNLKKTFPNLKYWIVGNKPNDEIKSLQNADNNIVVTGFVETPQRVLNKCSLAIIPWEGTYGFRSRLIELMSLGIPIITTNDAVDGMGLTNGNGIFFYSNQNQMLDKALELLSSRDKLLEISMMASFFVKENLSIESTYDKVLQTL